MFFIESSKRSSQINILTQHDRRTIYRHPCLIRTFQEMDSSFVFKDETNSFYYSTDSGNSISHIKIHNKKIIKSILTINRCFFLTTETKKIDLSSIIKESGFSEYEWYRTNSIYVEEDRERILKENAIRENRFEIFQIKKEGRIKMIKNLDIHLDIRFFPPISRTIFIDKRRDEFFSPARVMNMSRVIDFCFKNDIFYTLDNQGCVYKTHLVDTKDQNQKKLFTCNEKPSFVSVVDNLIYLTSHTSRCRDAQLKVCNMSGEVLQTIQFDIPQLHYTFCDNNMVGRCSGHNDSLLLPHPYKMSSVITILKEETESDNEDDRDKIPKVQYTTEELIDAERTMKTYLEIQKCSIFRISKINVKRIIEKYFMFGSFTSGGGRDKVFGIFVCFVNPFTVVFVKQTTNADNIYDVKIWEEELLIFSNKQMWRINLQNRIDIDDIKLVKTSMFTIDEHRLMNKFFLSMNMLPESLCPSQVSIVKSLLRKRRNRFDYENFIEELKVYHLPFCFFYRFHHLGQSFKELGFDVKDYLTNCFVLDEVKPPVAFSNLREDEKTKLGSVLISFSIVIRCEDLFLFGFEDGEIDDDLNLFYTGKKFILTYHHKILNDTLFFDVDYRLSEWVREYFGFPVLDDDDDDEDDGDDDDMDYDMN